MRISEDFCPSPFVPHLFSFFLSLIPLPLSHPLPISFPFPFLISFPTPLLLYPSSFTPPPPPLYLSAKTLSPFPFISSLSLFPPPHPPTYHFLYIFVPSSSPPFPLSMLPFFSLLSLPPSLSSILPELQCVFGHLLESKLQYYAPENFWKKFKLWGQPVNVREQQVSGYTWQASSN